MLSVPVTSDSLSALSPLALMLELGPLSISPLIEFVRRGSEGTLHKQGFLFLAAAAWPCVAQMQGQPVALPRWVPSVDSLPLSSQPQPRGLGPPLRVLTRTWRSPAAAPRPVRLLTP